MLSKTNLFAEPPHTLVDLRRERRVVDHTSQRAELRIIDGPAVVAEEQPE